MIILLNPSRATCSFTNGRLEISIPRSHTKHPTVILSTELAHFVQWEALAVAHPLSPPPSQHLTHSLHISQSFIVFQSHRPASSRNALPRSSEAPISSRNALRWPRLSQSTLPPPLVPPSFSLYSITQILIHFLVIGLRKHLIVVDDL